MMSFIFKCMVNLTGFVEIASTVLLLVFSVQWINDLANQHWQWLNFFQGIFKPLLDFSSSISTDSIVIGGVSYEYKYFITIGIFILIILLCRFVLKNIIAKIEFQYNNSIIDVKKANERFVNRNLQKSFNNQVSKLNSYSIAFCVVPNKEYKGITAEKIEEVTNSLIKFLSSKFQQTPIHKNGFYQFNINSMDSIDNKLDVLFSTITPKSKIGVCIVIQVQDANFSKQKSIETLINLNIFNKIIMTAETAQCYKNKGVNHFNVSSAGAYQIENRIVNVSEFTKKSKPEA